MRILVINGPNINFLGIREKHIYGAEDYAYLLQLIKEKSNTCNVIIDTFQSNGEGEIIDRIQQAYKDGVTGIVINPGAYTHYSYAIKDALASVDMPKIEVHISNVHKREDFRHVSLTASECDGQIAGFGLQGYMAAIDQVIYLVNKRNNQNKTK